MEIISPFAEKQEVEKCLSALTTGNEIQKALHKFIYEVCAAHDLQVESVQSNDSATLVLKDSGLPGAKLSVINAWNNRGSKQVEVTYQYRCSTIKKDRSSAYSDRHTRDSTNIQALLRTIKKHDEIPDHEHAQRQLCAGLRYPFELIAGEKGRFSIPIDGDLSIALTKFGLGLDKQLASHYIHDLQKKYSDHLVEVEKSNEARNNAKRFATGATVVCLYRHSDDPIRKYFLGTVDWDYNKSTPTFHVPLKRYSTLKDSPIAPIVMMIRTYMENHPRFDKSNELGIPLSDHHYKEIDVSTGYSTSDTLWVAIPSVAP